MGSHPGGRCHLPESFRHKPQGRQVAPGLGGERRPQLVPIAWRGHGAPSGFHTPSADAPAARRPHGDPGVRVTRGSVVGT